MLSVAQWQSACLACARPWAQLSTSSSSKRKHAHCQCQCGPKYQGRVRQEPSTGQYCTNSTLRLYMIIQYESVCFFSNATVEAGNKVTSRCWQCVLWREALKHPAPHLSWLPAVVPVGVLWLAVLRSPHHCLLQGILHVVSAMSSSQLPILHKI